MSHYTLRANVFYLFIFIYPIYRAKVTTYVTRTIGRANVEDAAYLNLYPVAFQARDAM